MRAIRRALVGIWSFIVDLCVDGYKTVSFSAPVLSITFTLAKFYEVPMNALRDISYAWGLVPITIWFFVAYAHRRAMSGRRRATKKLREFYSASDTLLNRKVTTEDEFKTYERESNQWLTSCANWIRDNIGPGARSRFLDRTGMYATTIVGAFNADHSQIVLNVSRFRQNLATLIETDAWDD